MRSRKQKWSVLALAVLLLACFLSGCTQKNEEPVAPRQEKKEGLQVGMSFDSFVIERWLRDRDLFELTAKNLGAEVNVQVANGDAKEQASQIQYFIKKNVDVIVIIAVDGEQLSDVVAEAKAAGIQMISYDRLVMNADTDLYISFDNEKVGTLMGQAMVETLPEGGNIFAIYGSPADNNVSMVQKGFYDAIEGSGLEIVYSSYCDNWLAELAFDAVEEGLATTPRNLVGVMCGNDDLASQAFRALAENRLAGKVVLVGQDAELSACQRIVEGTQTMTVYKPVEQLAQKAAEFACALGYQKMLAEGRIEKKDIPDIALERAEELKKLDKISDFSDHAGEDGKTAKLENNIYVTADENGVEAEIGGNVPYYSIEPVAVTKENMDEVIIGSDFHTAEDVYLNVENGK
ncbi:MAG: substrate-binding domain-containing protein [Lachnospiraceae bacterium]|nr:substrate-binding domain-containing protein [Lachnospiraceae bacterium]